MNKNKFFNIFFNFKAFLSRYRSSNKLVFILAGAALFLSITTYFEISRESGVIGPDPARIIGLLLSDLIIFLALGVLVSRNFFKNFFSKRDGQNISKLQNRIIVAFSLMAAVPTIIVSIFSAYFFNFGIQSWFDNKISTVLDQSVIVAESYIAENTIQLRETAISVAEDLSEIYYDLIHNPRLFAEVINAQAEMRSLAEAIVFQRSTNTVLAQSALSFSLSFATIPMYLIEKADRGDVVEVKTDQTRIRILIKLRGYSDTYLLIGRLIDPKIIDHVSKTEGAAHEYYRLKKRIMGMQIKFSVVFIFVALLLLLAAISWGALFARQIVRPIRKLVIATDKAKKGDLTVQVPEGKGDDEIELLSVAFNRMIKQINHQQKDLVIAQRALAWSDVARRVAHEIKNPLTPIQLSAERLQKKFGIEVSDAESFNRYIQTIMRHTNDIKRIISEFVNFARLPTPTFSQCDLIELVKDFIESKKSINDKIHYEFTSTFPSLDFICDVMQINQVMVNLIKNAEEALESDKERNSEIKVSIYGDEEFINLVFSDNGPGFSKELIGIATEAYITSRSKGTGLGLAIVKKIVQDHFGTIELSNNVMGGASIKLIFNRNELKSKLK